MVAFTHFLLKIKLEMLIRHDIMSDEHLYSFSIPRGVKVDIVNHVVAPSAVDRSAEASVPGLLQSGEAVFEETLKARLGGLQQGHVLQPAVYYWDACGGRPKQWITPRCSS